MIDFILRPFRRNFGKDKQFYAAIDDMFGFIPNNIELYKLALIHKSASVAMEDGRHVNNERLEYLGDAVIESVTSDYLFIEFPDKNEGFLTQLRSKMVSRQTLNEVAKRIGLHEYVITNTSNNSSQKHIYGDAFEAMMGAIYLDQGYDFVNRLLINKIFVDYIKVDNLTEEETDFKSRLIEWCQKNHHQIYFSTHNDKNYSSSHPSFYSKVLIDNIEVGYGVGDSKKEAEQRAAYSVAHGVNDDDCTKLMDKLDMLEAQESHSVKERTNPKREKRNVKEEKNSAREEVANVTEQALEKQKAATPELESKPDSEVKGEKVAPKPRVKRAPKNVNNDTAEQNAAGGDVTPKEEQKEAASANNTKKSAPKTNTEKEPKINEKASKPKAKKGDKSDKPKQEQLKEDNLKQEKSPEETPKQEKVQAEKLQQEKLQQEKPKSEKPKSTRKPRVKQVKADKNDKRDKNEKIATVASTKGAELSEATNLTKQVTKILQTNEESA